MLHLNRSRAESFGTVAELYDRARRSYPSELMDVLLVDGAGSALDAGCGTGLPPRGSFEMAYETVLVSARKA